MWSGLSWKKTTFGYELKAVGLNKNAARYAGINEKKNLVLSMVIAGALAGFGAGLYYLAGVSEWNPLNSTTLPAMGFNGISVALLASSNPIGTIFSALFISHITVGGSFLSTRYYPTEVADLISGIIYLPVRLLDAVPRQDRQAPVRQAFQGPPKRRTKPCCY